jgi:hypothetical protein
MVGEVGVGAGIVKGKFSCDKKAVLVVTYRKRTTECCTGFSISDETVCEEKAAFCRCVYNVTGLSDKTIINMCPVQNRTACLDNAVI